MNQTEFFNCKEHQKKETMMLNQQNCHFKNGQISANSHGSIE